MLRAINVERFHKPLADAGLVPPNCRLLNFSIGVKGALVLRYEVFLTPEQTIAFGLVLQNVGAEVINEDAQQKAQQKDR